MPQLLHQHVLFTYSRKCLVSVFIVCVLYSAWLTTYPPSLCKKKLYRCLAHIVEYWGLGTHFDNLFVAGLPSSKCIKEPPESQAVEQGEFTPADVSLNTQLKATVLFNDGSSVVFQYPGAETVYDSYTRWPFRKLVYTYLLHTKYSPLLADFSIFVARQAETAHGTSYRTRPILVKLIEQEIMYYPSLPGMSPADMGYQREIFSYRVGNTRLSHCEKLR